MLEDSILIILRASETKLSTESVSPTKIKRLSSPMNVIFILEGNSVFTFTGVEEPELILDVVKEIQNQVNAFKSEKKDSSKNNIQTQNRTMKCSHCGKKVPSKSNFCNFCGSKITDICSKCNNVNPAGSEFCNKCGFILN